jgi:hypothetical protein
MYAGEIEGHKALIATAERRIAKAQVEMAKVAEARDAARGNWRGSIEAKRYPAGSAGR